MSDEIYRISTRFISTSSSIASSKLTGAVGPVYDVNNREPYHSTSAQTNSEEVGGYSHKESWRATSEMSVTQLHLVNALADKEPAHNPNPYNNPYSSYAAPIGNGEAGAKIEEANLRGVLGKYGDEDKER
jgi:hypothetical protein